MICKAIILLVLVSYVVSDSCVRYTFEDNFDEWLTHQWGGTCVSMPFWNIGKYSTSDLTAPNELSTSFITPVPALSCVSSFMFPMNYGGTIEVNVYMESSKSSDQIIVMAYNLDVTGEWATGMVFYSIQDPNFVTGWRALRITLTGPDTYVGYISIMGMASPDSTVLVDSFRYIPPGIDERDCMLYEHDAGICYSKT